MELNISLDIMSNIDKNLSDIFGVTPMEKPSQEVIEFNPKEVVDKSIEDDFTITRNNLYSLLQQGKDALEHALEVAKTSEHPRAFEVVGNLMKQLSDINHQLVDLHGKKSDLSNRNKEETKQPNRVTNNAIFVGSTTELSKMIENMRKGD